MKKLIFTTLCFLLLNAIKAQDSETRMLYAINAGNLPAWDNGMKALSFSTYPLAPVAVAGILSQGYLTKNKQLVRSGYKSAVAISLAAGLSFSVKYLVHRTRPGVAHPGYIVERDHSGAYSFPSGHATVSFATATALSLTYKNWYVTIPAFLYAGFVSYSRMRLGLHYPSDILGGMISGIGSGLLTWQLDKRLKKKQALISGSI